MSWVEDAVTDFGRGMGVDGLALPEEGALSFEFEQRGTLYLERSDHGLVIYIARPFQFPSVGQLRTTLQACHYNEAQGPTVRVGLHDDVLVFYVHLPEAEVSLPELDRTVERLTELHDRMADA